MALKPVYKDGLPVVLNGQALEVEETGRGAGGGWENLPLLRTETIEEEVKGIELSELDIQHRAMIVVEMPKTTTSSLYAGVSVYINGKTTDKKFLNFNTYGIFCPLLPTNFLFASRESQMEATRRMDIAHRKGLRTIHCKEWFQAAEARSHRITLARAYRKAYT